MAFKTVTQLTQSVISLVGLVTGTGVQTYTEPQIRAAIQAQFDMLFIKRFWEWMTDWHTLTLDGVTGIVTADMTTFLSDPTDIESVYITDTNRRIVRPIDREHLRSTGSSPQYYTPLLWTDALVGTRFVKFWPIASTGNVDIRCRTKPVDFTEVSTVPFPDVVMSQAVAWHLLDNDGINPTAAAKAQLLYETSYRDLIASIGEDVIGHGGARSYDDITIRTI
jgi:hypothetical protein